MADPGPSPWAHSPIEKLYGNSPDLFRAPPPPAPLPIEAKLYGNSPQLFAANLREQQEHWQTQAGFRDPGELAAAETALARLPPVVRGTLTGAGRQDHPDVLAWLGRIRR